MQATIRWLLLAACWLLVVACWLLVAACWLLVVGWRPPRRTVARADARAYVEVAQVAALPHLARDRLRLRGRLRGRGRGRGRVRVRVRARVRVRVKVRVRVRASGINTLLWTRYSLRQLPTV